MAARTALKLGAKLPVLAAVGSLPAAVPLGLPAVHELRPHWQVPGVCRSVLLDSLRAISSLLQV